MRSDKLFRFVGLGLVLLFPLVSVLQLGDTDAEWRTAAKAVRPAVVSFHVTGADAPALGCGVVVQTTPLRIVVAGVPRAGGLYTQSPKGPVHWQRIYSDAQAAFSVLQATGDLDVETVGASHLESHGFPAIRLDFAGDVPAEGMRAALVAPEGLDTQPLWVGVLNPGEARDGRPAYRSSLLRPVRAAAALSTTDAYADEAPAIDPVLRGAPFVDSQGQVVALYLGRNDDGIEALPIEVVARTLMLLHLQAAQ